MSQPRFALPDQLRCDHATPSSLGTDVQAWVAVVVPNTGASPITVQAGSYFIVTVSKSGENCVFDPMNSFLCFKLTLSDTAAAGTGGTPGGINIDLYGNCECFFWRC